MKITSTPWGKPQTIRLLAEGIWTVSTARHGGIKLDRKRNAEVPDYMRIEGGWYEEDCSWAIAAVVHTDAFKRVVKIDGKPDRLEWEYAHETLKRWMPDEYERFTGIKIMPGESYKRDEQLFKQENLDNFVVSAAWGDWDTAWVPKGMIGVLAKRERDGARKWFHIPAEGYPGSRPGFVIDLTRHKETDPR
jgi:hypothetical protein